MNVLALTLSMVTCRLSQVKYRPIGRANVPVMGYPEGSIAVESFQQAQTYQQFWNGDPYWNRHDDMRVD